MPIAILKEEKKQKNLLLIFLVLLFLILVIVFWGIFRRKEIFMSPIVVSPPKAKTININFEILQDKRLKDLEVFEELSLPEERGRENPFLPYKEGELDTGEE